MLEQALAPRSSSGSREGGRGAARSTAAGPQPPAERRHRRPTVAVAAQLAGSAAAPAAAAAAGPDDEAAAQAAEADGALERFTEFLGRHEGELQPRTRQVTALKSSLHTTACFQWTSLASTLAGSQMGAAEKKGGMPICAGIA